MERALLAFTSGTKSSGNSRGLQGLYSTLGSTNSGGRRCALIVSMEKGKSVTFTERAILFVDYYVKRLRTINMHNRE